MADPVLGPYQASVGPVGSGVLIGTGTNYTFKTLRGLGAPDRRTNDLAPAAASGVYLGTDFYGPRLIEVDGLIVRGTSASDCQANLDTLEAAWGDLDDVIRFRFRLADTTVRYVDCRNRGFDYDPETLRLAWVRVAPALLVAGDPTWVVEIP